MTKQTLTWGFMVSLVLAAACWGFGALMSKYALEQIPPLTLLMVQLFVSVALLWLAVLVQGARPTQTRCTAPRPDWNPQPRPGLHVQLDWPDPDDRQHVGLAVGRRADLDHWLRVAAALRTLDLAAVGMRGAGDCWRRCGRRAGCVGWRHQFAARQSPDCHRRLLLCALYGLDPSHGGESFATLDCGAPADGGAVVGTPDLAG